MPTLVTAKFPKLKSEDEFEDLATDLLARFWRAPVERHGRRGQEQHGVDASAEPSHLAGDTAGAQYKNVSRLSLSEIEAEVAKAEGFEPVLADFIIVTALDRDATLQRDVRALRATRRAAGRFPVSIWFWQDVERELAAHPDLVSKYFGEWRAAFSAVSGTPDEEEAPRSVVDWSTFYVTLADDAPRSETYLMLRAEPVEAVPLVLDGELVDAFRAEVEQILGTAAHPSTGPVRPDAIDLVWRSPGGRVARKWRRGADGSVGFVTTVESAFQPGRVSLWEVAVDCLAFGSSTAAVRMPGWSSGSGSSRSFGWQLSQSTRARSSSTSSAGSMTCASSVTSSRRRRPSWRSRSISQVWDPGRSASVSSCPSRLPAGAARKRAAPSPLEHVADGRLAETTPPDRQRSPRARGGRPSRPAAASRIDVHWRSSSPNLCVRR